MKLNFQTTDMDGNILEVGQLVNRWPLINKKEGEPKRRKIKHISPMHAGGESMIWFEGGGGAHHPKACELIE